MRIKSQIDGSSSTFKENYQHNLQASQFCYEQLKKAEKGGAQKDHDRQTKLGKLSARARLKSLLDEQSSFLELSTLAGKDLYEDDVPCGGIITGIGLIEERTCMIIANDPSVKGGTYYPITVKKHLRAQKIAAQNHLPCIYVVDSGGAFLPMQDQVFPDYDHFGRIFYNQARMSSKGIPQIAVVCGFCTAGGAYIPAMSDQSIIVKGTGTIFLAGPPLVKAATGEEITAEELGGARVHTSISGVSDHLAENDDHALLLVREIIRHLGKSPQAKVKLQTPQPPFYDPDELLGIIPKDPKKHYDVREVIGRIVDGSEFFEFKANFGSTLVTGFAHIEGIPVAILANNGVLFSESALKATHFIEIACQESIPLLFLQNITGFIVGKEYEHRGIAKDGAKMVHAVANANVPKVTCIIGSSYGAGNYGMCGRGYDPDFLFMWPTARIAVMGGEQAANVLATVKEQQMQREGQKLTEQQLRTIKQPILEKYEKESSAYYSSARLWDDGIIEPKQTRKHLAMALAATLHHDWSETRFGILRM